MESHLAEAATHFVGDLALVLVGATVIGVVFRRLGQPAVLGYLLTGFVVGPYIPLPLFADEQRVGALAEFGVVLVMLSVGLEFSVRRLGEVLPKVGVPALVQMSTLAWLGFLIGRAIGWSGLESVFLGACLAISSTMVVAQVLREVEVSRPVRDLALGVLVMQDVVAILAIAALTATVFGSASARASAVASTAGELLLFLLALLVVGLLVVPRAIRFLVRSGSSEMLVVAVAALGFGLAVIATKMGYSVALGAFVAGALVAESGEGRHIATLVAPLRDVFAAVFFVAVGMSVDPAAIGGVIPIGIVVVVTIVVAQLISIGIGGTLAGRGLSTSVHAGAALGQIGEFSFIIAAIGVGSGAVRPELASIVVLAAIATAFTTPLVLRGAGSLAARLDRRLPRRQRRLLTLYPSWHDDLSEQPTRGPEGSRWRRVLAAISIDLLALIGLTLLVATSHGRLAATVASQTGLAVGWGEAIIVLGAVAVALPFVIGLVRNVRRLGKELAERALPKALEGLDLAAEPRRAMARMLEVLAVLVAASIFITATQPVLPAGWGVGLLIVALLAISRAFRRTSERLDGHVRAGAQAFAEALLSRESSDDFEDVERLLPGLGDLAGLVVPATSPVIGKSLAELDLRGRTGATVLAVRRGEDTRSLPGADWCIGPGDVLGLTGSHDAIALAREMLLGGAAKRDVEPAPSRSDF